MTSYFSVSQILWLKNGGVFAIPNLPGDGEYGEASKSLPISKRIYDLTDKWSFACYNMNITHDH